MARTTNRKKAGSSKSRKKSAIAPRVAIVMGSQSDYPTMAEAEKMLDVLRIPYETEVVSAHRTPEEMVEFAQSARASGFRVVIAGAGGAAHLPGMIAALTELPVIGVPVPHGPLGGEDALLSIVQMPKGVPVATVAIGNATNAGILAAQVLGASEPSGEILDRIAAYKQANRRVVLEKHSKALKK